MAGPLPLVQQAHSLLHQELHKDQPCVARSSCIMGLLQEHLFAGSNEVELGPAVDACMAKFQELLVLPAAVKLQGGKSKRPQDKVIAIAKFLRGKLAKAPAQKQPLHTQYLPSALRDSGKRQLDCLGIATAVLALCHAIAAQNPSQHADLAAAAMVVSDDHCWLGLLHGGGSSSSTAAAAVVAAAEGGNEQQEQQLLHVEVTDPRELQASQMINWLYAGGHGQPCSPHQIIMILVAGLMPEELKDDAAAGQLRAVQLALLQQLAAQYPAALFYSNFFRWGMLHEESELEQLAAAAESGNMEELQQLALLPRQQLQSQVQYSESIARSEGAGMWHPHSCAAFGWLNRMQAALCGDTDDLLALTRPAAAASGGDGDDAAGSTFGGTEQQQQQVQQGQQQLSGQLAPANLQQQQQNAGPASAGAAAWLHIATFLLQQALSAVQGCTAVLRQYNGCAGKPDKSADKQLMEAVRDLWQNLADACKAVACLQGLQQCEASQQQQQQQQQQDGGVQQQGTEVAAAAAATQQPEVAEASPGGVTSSSSGQQGHLSAECGHTGSDMPAAAAVTGPTVHLAAAVSHAAARHCRPSSSSGNSNALPALQLKGVINEASWLLPQLAFMDALCAYYGDESADLPAEIVADFLVVAGTFSSGARVQAAAAAAAGQQLQSSRIRGLAEVGSAAGCAWQEMAADLQQLVQMPSSRKRKRKE